MTKIETEDVCVCVLKSGTKAPPKIFEMLA